MSKLLTLWNVRAWLGPICLMFNRYITSFSKIQKCFNFWSFSVPDWDNYLIFSSLGFWFWSFRYHLLGRWMDAILWYYFWNVVLGHWRVAVGFIKSGTLSRNVKIVFSRLHGFPQQFRVCWFCLLCWLKLLCHQHKLKIFSVEEALVRAVEVAQACCELACSAKLHTELFKVLILHTFSTYIWLYPTGWLGWFGWWVLRLLITELIMVVLF